MVATTFLYVLISMYNRTSPMQSLTDLNPPTSIHIHTPGIWSDIHMLALMYAGELCYWIWETTQTHTQTLSPTHTDIQTHTQSQSQIPTTTCTQTHTQKQLLTVSENVTRCKQTEDKGERYDDAVASERLQTTASSNSESRDEPCIAEATSFYSLMEHLQGKEFVQKWVLEFSTIQYGQDFLTKYVDAARGPLASQGWSYDRAVQLLVKLKKAGRETH